MAVCAHGEDPVTAPSAGQILTFQKQYLSFLHYCMSTVHSKHFFLVHEIPE